MENVYGCEKRGFVELKGNRECDDASCGYRMQHGKCGCLLVKTEEHITKQSLNKQVEK